MQPIHAIRALKSSALGKRLLTTSVWSALGEALSKGMLLIAMALVARILGKEGFGEFGIIRTTINMFALIGGLGLGFTANRFVARYRDSDKVYSGQIIGSSYLVAAAFGLLVAIVLFTAAGTLARDALGAPALKGSLRIAAGLLFLNALTGAQTGVLQGLEAFKHLALGGLSQGLVGIVLFTLGAHYFGLDGALIAFVVYSALGVVIYDVLIRAEMRRQSISVSYTGFEKGRPILWSFSIPAALMGIAVAPFKWLCETLLAKGSGFAQLGVFHAALTISNIFLALVSTLNSPLVSVTSNLQGSAGSGRMEYLNLYGPWFLFLFLAAPVLLVPKLPSLVFGAGFAGGDFQAVSILLVVYSGLLVYYHGVMRMIALHGSLWFGLITNLCEGTALLAAFWLLRGHGVLGLGIAYVCSYIVRIVTTSPFLLSRGIVRPKLLFDRYFLLTFLLLLVVAAVQVGRQT